MLLAIDTSTALIGLACYDQEGLRGESCWQSGRNHSAQLLPQLQMLLRHIGYAPADVLALAVACGPGSWSGLRVGMSVAKGMALAGGLALLGISTLDALAYQHPRSPMPIYPVIRLGRDRFASAVFQHEARFERLSADRNVSLDELCAAIDENALFCGDIDPELQQELRRSLGPRAVFPSPAANMRRPGYLAELAWQRFSAGERDDIATLEPVYLGEPVKTK